MILELFLAAGATVTLPMDATVRGTEIELSEIASIEGTPEIVALLERIELGYAPAPGYSRLLRADRVQEMLARHAPGVTVKMAGHSACRVRPDVVEITPDRIEAAARAELNRFMGIDGAGFTLREAIRTATVPVGRGPTSLVARPLGGERVSGAVSVPVDLQVDGSVYRTVWTSWGVEVWETRAVLARAVRAGEALEPRHFERRRVRVDKSVRAEPLERSQVVGAVAVRDLVEGEVVTQLDVHRPTVVSLGDSIFLSVRKGGIEARVPAIALESGSVGDRIRVRTADSSKELSAAVISRDLVEVRLGR